MRRRPELMQFEIGISTMRYFPASGTAGLERSLVSGNRRVPAPPPMMIAREFSVIVVGVEKLIDKREVTNRRDDGQVGAASQPQPSEKYGWCPVRRSFRLLRWPQN